MPIAKTVWGSPMMPPETPLFAGIPILIANSPLALYIPHVTINVLQILAISFGMICSPVSGCLPFKAKTQADFRQVQAVHFNGALFCIDIHDFLNLASNNMPCLSYNSTSPC